MYSSMGKFEEPQKISAGPFWQNTDNAMDYSSKVLRFELEQNIASIVQSRLGSEPPTAASSAVNYTCEFNHFPQHAHYPERESIVPSGLLQEGLKKKMPDQNDLCRPSYKFEECGMEEPEPVPAASDGSRASFEGELEQHSGLGHIDEEDIAEPGYNSIDPEIQALRALAENGGGLSGCTTIMIRNVPFKYTQRKLVREINTSGFLGKYDFLYLPMDPRSHGNRGFAFVNFISAKVADDFYKQLHGKKLRHFSADAKEVVVLPADLQGFEQNAMRYAVTQTLRGKRTGHTKPIFLRAMPPAACSQMQARTEQYWQQRQFCEAAEHVESERQRMAIAWKAQQRKAEALKRMSAIVYSSKFDGAKPMSNSLWTNSVLQQVQCHSDADTMILANVLKSACVDMHPQAFEQDPDPNTMASIIKHVTAQAASQQVTKEPSKMQSTYTVKFCKYCGNARTASHSFCPFCGSKIV